MDRDISNETRRRRLARRALAALALVCAVGLLLFGLPRWLRPSVSRERIRIARVERGPVEAVIEASGTVIPASEKVLSSPVEARVVRILKRTGETARAGDTIVELDTSEARLETERIEDRLALKRNEEAQLRIALDRSLGELEDRIQKGKLDLEILSAKVDRSRRLGAEGLVSSEELREAEVEAQKARIELDHLESSMEAERRATRARLAGTALDLRILEKELAAAKHRLELATARADEDGVVTWVVPQEGATVARGEIIGRIARLDSFRVEAAVADVHTPRLRPGAPVKVLAGGQVLSGTLTSVNPAIENGVARFFVDLEDRSNPLLRASLRVDVLVVTDTHEDAWRIARGPFAQGGTAQPVFVVNGNRAHRTEVRFGLAGREFLEVLDGLSDGDEVIVSDMQDYVHLREVRIH